jgi:hypothetical protein
MRFFKNSDLSPLKKGGKQYAVILAVALLAVLCVGPADAQAITSNTNVTLNITVNESVTVSTGGVSSLSATYTSGNVVFTPLTVTSSWNTSGAEASFYVYATFAGGATALSNGASTIPTSNVSVAVTGTAAQGNDFCNNGTVSLGGPFMASYNESCAGGAGGNSPGLSLSNVSIIYFSNINKNGAGAANTQAAVHPNGSASNTVTFTVVPIAQMLAGTYSGTVIFTASAS